jgi:hypothetical protein
MRPLLAALLLTSCAELRSGWVHVEFEGGKMESVMVCTFENQRNPRDGEAEIVSECRGVKSGRFLLVPSPKENRL